MLPYIFNILAVVLVPPWLVWWARVRMNDGVCCTLVLFTVTTIGAAPPVHLIFAVIGIVGCLCLLLGVWVFLMRSTTVPVSLIKEGNIQISLRCGRGTGRLPSPVARSRQ